MWLPVFAVCSREHSDLLASLWISTLLATVWLLALRRAFADARATAWALGTSVAAGVGSAVGVVGVTAASAALGVPVSGWAILWAWVGVFVCSCLWEHVVGSSMAARQKVLVVGTAGGGSELIEELGVSKTLPFELVGVVDDDRQTDQVAGAPVRGRLDRLAEVVLKNEPDLVVLADERCRLEAFERLVDVAYLGFSVVGLAEFYEHAFGRLPVRHLSPRWFMSVLHLYQRPYSRLAKRTFDVVVSAFGLLLTAPLFPLVYALVRRTPGPVIFRQTRLGEVGVPFTILKFRTMRSDAERDGAVWASEYDPRVTGVGRFLRKTRLDELPQLVNVLRGEMSIVGPRPERPEFVVELQREVPYWSRRHLAKPGITGWAQVRRGYTADAEGTGDKLSYDLWYLRHRSFVVDLAICMKTASILLSGSGAR